MQVKFRTVSTSGRVAFCSSGALHGMAAADRWLCDHSLPHGKERHAAQASSEIIIAKQQAGMNGYTGCAFVQLPSIGDLCTGQTYGRDRMQALRNCTLKQALCPNHANPARTSINNTSKVIIDTIARLRAHAGMIKEQLKKTFVLPPWLAGPLHCALSQGQASHAGQPHDTSKGNETHANALCNGTDPLPQPAP